MGTLNAGLLDDAESLNAGLLSCLSTAQPASETVPPIRFGGQYRKIDLPNIFLAGREPLNKTIS